jgi:hypothetical protein
VKCLSFFYRLLYEGVAASLLIYDTAFSLSHRRCLEFVVAARCRRFAEIHAQSLFRTGDSLEGFHGLNIPTAGAMTNPDHYKDSFQGYLISHAFYIDYQLFTISWQGVETSQPIPLLIMNRESIILTGFTICKV